MNARWIILCFPLQRKSRESQLWAWRSERYFLLKSYHNHIHIYSDCFGATDDLATTVLYTVSLIVIALCWVVIELQSVNSCWTKVCYYVDEQDRSTSVAVGLILFFLYLLLMKCKVWMLTESSFVFLCKENQERTNIELGQVKGIFYLNPIEILSSTVSRGRVTTNDLATTFFHLSDCSCTCLGQS